MPYRAIRRAGSLQIRTPTLVYRKVTSATTAAYLPTPASGAATTVMMENGAFAMIVSIPITAVAILCYPLPTNSLRLARQVLDMILMSALSAQISPNSTQPQCSDLTMLGLYLRPTARPRLSHLPVMSLLLAHFLTLSTCPSPPIATSALRPSHHPTPDTTVQATLHRSQPRPTGRATTTSAPAATITSSRSAESPGMPALLGGGNVLQATE